MFSNVSSNGLPERMHSRIGCICEHCSHIMSANNLDQMFPFWISWTEAAKEDSLIKYIEVRFPAKNGKKLKRLQKKKNLYSIFGKLKQNVLGKWETVLGKWSNLLGKWSKLLGKRSNLLGKWSKFDGEMKQLDGEMKQNVLGRCPIDKVHTTPFNIVTPGKLMFAPYDRDGKGNPPTAILCKISR